MTEVFPTIVGKNLNKHVKTIPGDFKEKNLLLLVAFQQWHQPVVDDCLNRIEAHHLQENHHVLEIPVIQKSTAFRRIRLDALMRAAIRDQAIRERTITVYLDKQAFMSDTNIPSEDRIHWFLVSHRTGAILLRGIGSMSEDDIQEIKAVPV
jgi:hypothetical protein